MTIKEEHEPDVIDDIHKQIDLSQFRSDQAVEIKNTDLERLKTRRKLRIIFTFLVLAVLTLGLGAYIYFLLRSTKTAVPILAPADSVSSMGTSEIERNETLMAYGWLRSRFVYLEKLKGEVASYENELKELETHYAGIKPHQWAPQDFQQWQVLKAEIVSLKKKYNDLAGEYNVHFKDSIRTHPELNVYLISGRPLPVKVEFYIVD